MIALAYILLATGAAALAAILRHEQLDRRKNRRWMTVQQAAIERIGEDIAWSAYRLDAVRAAMALTCRRYEQRLAEFVSDRVADRPDVSRAYDAVELAMAPVARLEVVR